MLLSYFYSICGT